MYNGEKFLEETIHSAFQTFHRPIEVIVVNDGSTDNSLMVAMKLLTQYSDLEIIDQENRGVAAARNTGIRKASGKYILPLDGDDLIEPEYISESIKILEKKSQIKVVYCQANKFNETGSKPWKLKPFSRNSLARDNMIFVSAVFRKSDWEEVGGFSEDMKMGREDWEFWIKMLKDGGEVVQLPFVGFHYRLTSDSKRKKTGTGKKKRERITYLNKKHPEFFDRELFGPLRFQRTWSKPYNQLLRFFGQLK